ncbi:MAG TPA: HXXEE domain-containing protein [Bryobacteraceae bacterium]|nr:HXXEE domain-containing protein [Bryobacteraceae bacterium]
MLIDCIVLWIGVRLGAMNGQNRYWVLLAPLVFAAHVAEEAPGYVRWFNGVAWPPIPESGFLEAQITPLAAAAVLAAGAAWIPGRWSLVILLSWATHFFFANAIFHIATSAATRSFSPGLVTGTVFYLPFYWWLLGEGRRRAVPAWTEVLVIFLAGLPAYLQTWIVASAGRRFY